MSRLFLLAVVLLLGVAALILLAVTPPNPGAPPEPCGAGSGLTSHTPIVCPFAKELTIYNNAIQRRWLYPESAEGLIVLAALAPLSKLRPSFGRRFTIRLPRATRDIALLAGLCFATLWLSYAVVDFYIPLGFSSVGNHAINAGHLFGLSFGTDAFLFFALAVVSFTIYSLGSGMLRAIKTTFSWFVVPFLFAFFAALAVFDTHEMSLSVTMFSRNISLFGVPLFSNCTVLIVLTGLVVLFLPVNKLALSKS